MADDERGWQRMGARRDLIWISLVCAVLVCLAAVTDGFESVHHWVARRLPGQEDEILVGFALATIGLGVFAIRRWREGRGYVAARDAAEDRFRTVVEKIPAVTYTWDPTQPPGSPRVRYVSPQVEPILGFSVERWLREPELWIRQVHPDDRERVLRASQHADRTGEPLVIEYRHLRGDGRLVWIREEAVAVERRADGRPTLVQGVMYDVTDRRHAEERLREAEARYRTLVERVPAVTYVWDTATGAENGAMTFISPQIRPLLGVSQDDWQSNPRSWHEHVHPDDLERVAAAWNGAKAAGAAFREEYRLVASDGSEIWVRDEAVPVAEADTGARTYQGVLFDITERKRVEQRLREAEERYRLLVEHIPAVLYIDPVQWDAPTLYVSPQVEQLLGVTQEHYLREQDLWLRLVHPADRDGVLESYRAAVESGQPWSNEYRIVRPDGRTIWVRDDSVFLSDEEGRLSLIQGVLFDITERKRAEEALVSSERRERLAAERLRSLDEMKNTFLAAVSHELRSPLTSILGTALTLQQGGLSEDDRVDLLGRLAANARKLDRLLEDLLDIDRLQRGIVAPQRRDTDLAGLVHRTVESLEALADRDVRLELEPLVMAIDPAKVERIVENLLVNATRHTDPGTTIWVRLGEMAGGAILAVEDEGPGVPVELQGAIFEPFRQGPTASPHSPGTGIGLSLVSMFAELHGGRAWVEDRGGGGASFRVFLPRTIEPEVPAANGDRAVDTAGGR